MLGALLLPWIARAEVGDYSAIPSPEWLLRPWFLP